MTPIETLLVGGIAGCVTAIVCLFSLEQSRHKEAREELKVTRERLEQCELVRNNTVARVVRLEAGCVLPECPLRKENQDD